MSELESERERRWKSEQATKKLVEHVQQLQTKGKFYLSRECKRMGVAVLTKFPWDLTNCREPSAKTRG